MHPNAPLKLSDTLIKARQAGEEREAERRAKELGLPYVNLNISPLEVEALALIPEARSRDLQVAIFEANESRAALAAAKPGDSRVLELIRELEKQNRKVVVCVASLRGLNHAWESYRFATKPTKEITGRVAIEKERVQELRTKLVGLPQIEAALQKFDYQEGSVTEFLEVTLAGALANRASDIHFEPEEKGVKLRYRIDGILHDVAKSMPVFFYRKTTSRLKLLSGIKLNIQNHPQDGRFTIELPEKAIEIRVAMAPAEYGEIIVLRILDPDSILSLTDLGIREDDLALIQIELDRPHGMILNTGPTGSGKTTTLYAFLSAKKTPEIKIVTIEDPIEYHLEGIEQTQVDEEGGYSFANGLRSILRQDPDSILVGEIRDQETAEIALQAALTGHLVFSTIHANEAAGAIPRLLDLGVKPTSIGPGMNLIISQRLVRRLCEQCKKPMSLDARQLKRFADFVGQLPERVAKANYAEIKLWRPEGCEACGNLGFKGRVGIYEILVTDEALEPLILSKAGETELARYAEKRGMVTMQADGVLKALRGITTVDEVIRETGQLLW